MPESTSPTTATASDPVGPHSRRRELVAGGGLLLACAVACSLPLLIGAGAAVSVTALLSGATILASGLALVAGTLAAWWLVRRNRERRAPTTAAGAPSACGGDCGC